MERIMEQETSKNISLSPEEETFGTVKIADDVVAMIAALAAMEVDGVTAMNGNVADEILSRAGVKGLVKGVKVEIRNRKVKVELAITMEYGYNIPATCQRVQNKVKSAIENMTGLEVTDVNIRISGIHMTH